MIWKYINSGFKTGQYNMDFDLNLARSCALNESFFRLYRWQPYCISLGANQNEKEINELKSTNENIHIVRRPTGGRAILHAEEVTYSVIIPLNGKLSPREIYTKISLALLRGLAKYDDQLSKADLEGIQPNFPALLSQPSGMLCFASTAKSEIKYNGKKLVGSAQRKMDKVVLQHGTILCGKFHQKLPEYLNADEENIKELKNELEEKTIEIETILGNSVNYEKLMISLVNGFEEEWDISLKEMNAKELL